MKQKKGTNLAELSLRDRIVEILEDRKAEAIEVISIKERSTLTDDFIICNGTSNTHVRALTDELIRRLEVEDGLEPLHEEGRDSNRWVLLDYGPVIVHIFHPEEREFYSLDKLWRRSN